MLTKKGVMLLVLLLAGIVAGSLMMSCTTVSSIGGTVDAHGLFSGAKAVINEGGEIASYSIILGFVDSGFDEYAEAVKQAEASGKQVTSVTKSYVVFTKTTAYSN